MTISNDPLEGVFAASLIPLHANLSCDVEALSLHCKDLLTRGCKGIVLFGTTGEGASFSTEEKLDILEQVLQQGLDPKKILIASIESDIMQVVPLLKRCLKTGCSHFLIVPPFFYKNVSDEGVIGFYREIFERVSDPNLKVILYHIPQFTGVPITKKIIATLLKEYPDIVIGIKESEGNLSFAKELLREFPGFKVYVGSEKDIIEAVHAKAAGSICGLANLYPELIHSLYEQGKKGLSSNPQILLNFFQAMEGHFFVSAFKAVLERKKGLSWHRLRPPLVPLNESEKEAFIAELERMNWPL